MRTPVNLIGAGRIGRPVAEWLEASDRYRLGAVIGRRTADWPPAPLTIDAAGPAALRSFGPRLLAEGELWSVGAAALIDPSVRGVLEDAARRSGNPLRLFTGWIAGPRLLPESAAATLHVTQCAPGLGPTAGTVFEGPLARAARAFPDHLNTATAAAVAGPGIEATTVRLVSTEDGAPHVIRAVLTMPGQTLSTEVRFDAEGIHPVASAIVAALEERARWILYG